MYTYLKLLTMLSLIFREMSFYGRLVTPDQGAPVLAQIIHEKPDVFLI